MGFNFPEPPRGAFPETAQNIANGVMAVLVLAIIVYAFLELRRGHGVLAIACVIGGAIAYVNEPMLDVLGLCWHPRDNQDVAITTFGEVPMWGLGIYIVFFGGGTYLFLQQIRRGLTRRAFWQGTLVFFAVNLAVEIPLIQAGVYGYYGYETQPFSVGGLPLYWLFINAGGPLAAACAIHALPHSFAGPRVLLVVLVPMSVYAAYCMLVGWPIFSALHMESLPSALLWAAAAMTMVMGAAMFDGLARWAAVHGPATDARRESRPSGTPSREDRPVAAAAGTSRG